ncbi:glycosyltransferase [Aeromonas diversa CDC 2478-85]|uniref:Glycosyltransferase n=1 Tax=Aeromonas diversa CDC 2478-85 TaxID=1268237 RepID=N9U0Y7_9GAMM|nr:glycosyltransferase [Aeromonas diversa]ENY71980.1 glycosyltransferase [Aeromonas diversa CDC 2478-85]
MKVSVLVPVYNLERFIEPCLLSLLEQQTQFDFEVIAIDDGSSDGSWSIMRRLAADWPQLTALQNPANMGLARTQKRLLGEAKGQYIVYVDGDDLALPGKLQVLADYLDQHPECALCYHEAEVFDSDTGLVTGHYSRDYYNAAYIPQQASVEHLIRYGCFPNASAIAFRRHPHLQEAVDGECKIILDHPWHILNALYAGGSVDGIPGVYGRYRIHSQSFGGQTKRSPTRREQVLADQLKACDNARPFGIAESVIAAGKAHYRFATALYFLKQGDIGRFERFINESVVDGWFFDARHQLAWEKRAEAAAVAQHLFGEAS